MRRKKRKIYKFAAKKHSRRGEISLVLAILSFLAGISMIVISVQSRGNANVYIGCAGLFSLLIAIVSLFMGLVSLGEDSYKLFPVLGSVCSGLTVAGWVAVYVLGFLLA